MKTAILTTKTYCRASVGRNLCGKNAVIVLVTRPGHGWPVCVDHAHEFRDLTREEIMPRMFHVEQPELPLEYCTRVLAPGSRE